MLNGGTKVAALCLVLVGCCAGIVPTTFGADTIHSPVNKTDEYDQRVWTKADGLPDNQVQAILQTSDGYLWIATRRGLARFDGLKFTAFDPLNTPEMRDDSYRSLTEDLDGNLWIGTTLYVVQKTGNHYSLRMSGNFDFSSMCSSRFGGVWIGSAVEGLARVRWPGLSQSVRNDDLPRGGVFAVEEDEMGVLWVGTAFGLLRRDPKVGHLETIDSGNEFTRQPVVALRRGWRGELWVLFAGHRPDRNWFGGDAWLACFKDGRWLRGAQLHKPDITIDPRGVFLAVDHSGNLWLPSAGGGLNRFSNGEFTFHAFSDTATNDFVLCVQEDREGNLWIGTERSGLIRWRPRRTSTYTTADGLPHDNIWTICETDDDGVSIGTDGGVSEFKDGRFTNFNTKDGLSNNRIRSLAVDRTGTVWVGTGDRLNELHDGKLSQTAFPYLPERTKIRVVLAGGDDTLWMGNIDGLHRLQNGTWTSYSQTNGLVNNDVRALLQDHSGSLWIGTAGGGVQQLRNGRFITFSTTNGLSNDSAWALHEDGDGIIWIGTEAGLNRLQDGQITVFTTREGLPVNLVNYILEDNFDRLWVSHDHGIYWMHRKELNDVAAGRATSVRCVAYDESDGLLSLETNGQISNPAGCKTRDGRLWFPTTQGVAVIDPGKVALDDVPPLTAIEQVRANGQLLFDTGPRDSERTGSTQPTQDQTHGDKTPTEDSQLPTAVHQLAAGSARVLEFRFTGNTFVAPEKARFKYRMLGLNENWIGAGTRREAYFTDLRPGDYQFEVIAANHHGVWQEHGATFGFRLAPFIYQTWWFYLVCGSATAALVSGLVIWRLRELRKIHRLEQHTAIIGERARIAKDLHDGLGADLTRLTMLADLASGESGAGGGEHLKKLSKSSREAARELKELIWVANPANDSVDGLVSRICQTVEAFLWDARIKCRLDIAPHLPQQSLSIEQRRNLLLVAREALHNVVKHAAATEVCIRANGNGDNLQLAIEDNGRGFDPGTARPDGLGLASMRRRIENLGGTFHLESRPNAGTRITIRLKLGQKQ